MAIANHHPDDTCMNKSCLKGGVTMGPFVAQVTTPHGLATCCLTCGACATRSITSRVQKTHTNHCSPPNEAGTHHGRGRRRQGCL
jgi:hypothetical protein